ncbi:phage holin family protein [Rhodophyticola porphyridii]|uniref:Phage holin family protein n=1 Tax=Rhodophyticola porphyridii TaxID=1852017 RepID=A0A3L9YAT6_9RHOB|nr:phage holin family protein [Rhodophyticola porphyridii]RMA43076.1 phage holin family protein [Rhodophyticola porphyridii]
MTDTPDTKESGSLISSVLLHLSRLIRKEFELAKAEMSEKVNRAAFAIGLLVIGAILLLSALNVLAGAAVAGLVELGLTPGWAALSVAGVVLLIAAVLGARGISILKTTRFAPTETVETISNDFATLKESIHDQ